VKRLDAGRFRENADRFLASRIAAGDFPGAVYAVGTGGAAPEVGAIGKSVIDPDSIDATTDTIYDLASTTKPLVTSTLILLLHREGAIDIEAPVATLLPEMRGRERGAITIRDLLTHSSGYQAWYPIYVKGTGRENYFETLMRRPLKYARGKRVFYSCLNFILLKYGIERVTGKPLSLLASERLFEPLSLKSTAFNPPSQWRSRIAATDFANRHERSMVRQRGLRFRGFRNGMIWGTVNDGNCFHLDGEAGNAGLFSTAEETYRLAAIHLGGPVLDDALRARERVNHTAGLDENRSLGWQMRSSLPNHPTTPFGPRAIGHTGFTGTSVWIDPDSGVVAVLLTNRIHPRVTPLNMQRVRHDFHRIVVESLAG
jgi:serine-type D-Ala-D-Ala carboxypeptidase